MPQPVTELDDIQGLLKTGYGDLTDGVYLLLRIRDRDAARAWLADMRPTSVADLKQRQSTAMQIALTAAGLRALGLNEALVTAFSPEFTSGLAGDESRSRRLGDVGGSAPGAWAWGGAWEPHILVMLFARPGGLDGARRAVETPMFGPAFEVKELATSDMAGREPFGFRDGLSQPVLDWDGLRQPGSAADLDYTNLITAGEFLLGYVNEYGRYTERPLLDPAADPGGRLPPAVDDSGRRDLGRNGSYLVFRQLDQDVRSFWRFIHAHAQLEQVAALAQAMVGRGVDGEPILPLTPKAIPGVGPKADDLAQNGFTFDLDADGLACPIGSHIRRANPRTGDMPGGNQGLIKRLIGMLGLLGGDPRADIIASARFHRVMRRGREYGAFLPPEAAARPDAPDPGSGLNFLCLNANISRQFEFIQSAWLTSAKFGGLSGEADPLIGSREPHPPGQPTDGMTAPQAAGPCRHLEALPRFITVRGGAYFFLPGLRALRFLAG